MRTLPLFPLNTVLFPDAPLPLRVFEPRYRELLDRCLEEDRRFGVVLIRSGREARGPLPEAFEVGTIARIIKVDEEMNGAIPVEVVGESRFAVSRLDRSHSYLVGEVDILNEEVDRDAATETKRAYRATQDYLRLLFTVQGEWRRELDLPTDPVTLSFFLGTVLLAHPAPLRQSLLEATPVSRRLRVGAKAVEEATRGLRENVMRAGPGRDRSVFGLN